MVSEFAVAGTVPFFL